MHEKQEEAHQAEKQEEAHQAAIGVYGAMKTRYRRDAGTLAAINTRTGKRCLDHCRRLILRRSRPETCVTQAFPPDITAD